MPQVTSQAPAFKATALMPDKTFKEISLADYKGKWVVLFFYPLDFTFVCPTEIIAYSEKQAELSKVGAQAIACSVDSQFTHLAWVNTSRADGGLGEMHIPILADLTKQVSRDYGVLLDGGIALRGTFIIDPKGIVRHSTVNDLPVGRNVDEALRIIQAFQFVEKHGEVCPADWKPGDDTMSPDTEKSKKYFKKHG
ncbi:MAG: peroxiredoxin [Nitrospirota bacterium]|nr:peroxiredoxin [Nitrospirota bacterium]